MTNHWTDYKNSDVFMVIGANPAENHPISMKWILRAKEEKNAKLIVVDPRFSKTANMADLYIRIRPGTDIALLNGLMNYAIQNNKYHHDYVVHYTNATYLVNPEFSFQDGLFSGFQENSYNTETWQYQTDGNIRKKDYTLQDPNCVFQLLKKHLSRYDIKTVCSITGVEESKYREFCELYCSTGQSGKAGNLIYAMGITQHTYGAQNVRATAMLQLLLGNIGIPGGGVNAQRGESNVQGSTDMGMLFGNLPGYLGMPKAALHPTLPDYVEKETPFAGYWVNKSKFLVSMLKAWYGTEAHKDNEFAYQWLPKLDHQEHSHMKIFQDMNKGVVKGFLTWGQNPVVGGPNTSASRKALEKLDWMVAIDLFETETAAFWKAPGADPSQINTEVFLLPAVASYEKEGTVSNSGRWIQWRYKAIDGPGQAKSDLWIAHNLFKKIRETFKNDTQTVFPEPVLNMVWNYDHPGTDEPNIEQVAIEINGYSVDSGDPLKSFGNLKDDGSTAAGLWIYTGYYADREKPACKNREREKEGISTHLGWSWAWPLNRRILYNRCSADPSGNPWNDKLPLFFWDGLKWVSNDVPDFNASIPPEESAVNPYIMLQGGCGRLYAQGLKEGPFPEHYEPVETPVKNQMSGRQNNPCISFYDPEMGALAEIGSSEFPYICTTHRLIEHYQSGACTRNMPYLAELMPEMFVQISPQLGAKLNIENGNTVEVLTKRGSIHCKVCVTPTMKALLINGQEYEVIGMPWHWGYQGMATGDSANTLTSCVGDPNTNIPEYKAFLCNIRKA